MSRCILIELQMDVLYVLIQHIQIIMLQSVSLHPNNDSFLYKVIYPATEYYTNLYLTE